MSTTLPRKVNNHTQGNSGRFTVAFLLIGAFIGGFAFSTSTVLAVINHRPKITWASTGSGATLGPDQQLTSGTFSDEVYAVTDADTPSSITLTIDSSSDSSWCPTSYLSVTGTLPNLTVHWLTQPSGNGVTTITIKAVDGSSSNNYAVTSFTIQKTSTLGASFGSIPDQTVVSGGTTGALGFITAGTTAAKYITAHATSSNTTLVPSGGIAITDLNRTHTITINPASGVGYATITVSDVASGTPQRTTSFTVMVNTGAAPSISALTDVQVATLTATPAPTTVSFTVSDDNNTANLAVSATSSNALLVPNTTTNISPGGTGSSRSATITPAAGRSGASTITVAVSDNNFTRYSKFLFVVEDPNDLARKFSRSKGVFILDSSSGNNPPTDYCPTGWGYCIDYRDYNLRSYSFVDGYTLRVPWNYIENNNVANSYDFTMIDHLLGELPAGQSLSILFVGEPAYVLTGATDKWTPTVGSVDRPAPWDSYLMARWDALLSNMAGHTGPNGPLGSDTRITILNPSMPGGDSGIRDPDQVVNFVDIPSYTKEKLFMAAEHYLRTLQVNFPGRHVQIGFWKLRDENPTIGLTEWLRTALLAEFNGIVRPRVGFWREDFGTARLTAATEFVATPTAYTSTPGTTTASPLSNSEDVTWTAFQTLDSWAGLFNDDHTDKMLNATANDGYEAAFNPLDSVSMRGYKTQYFETYVADVEAAQANAPYGLQRWHTYFASLNPIEAPAGLSVALTSSSSNTITWIPVFGATSYTLERQPLGGTATIFTGITSPTYPDTGLSYGTAYAYRVKAIGSSTSDYSPSVAVFRSVSGEDGYVSYNATTMMGQVSTSGSGAAGIRTGQSTTSQGQTKGFTSFDTGQLPDTSNVIGGVFREEQGSADFTVLGPCTLEIINGSFNGTAALEVADFSYAATTVGELPKVMATNWAELDLGSVLSSINTGTGRTQFRQSFAPYGTPNTYMSWYPGDSVGNEPQLVVRYWP